MTGAIPTRRFGRHDEEVSLLGVGGAHIGFKEHDLGIRIIRTAIDAGATFMDNAWEYNAGVSEVRMGEALKDGYRDRAFLMTKDCAHDRVAKHSMQKLEQSLQRLKTDRLDLWMLHEVVWEDDPDTIFAPGGSAESLLKAKEQGKTRYVGFTGHKSPSIHRRMLSQGFPWDAVLMPLNVLDAHYESFEREIVPMCLEQGIAVLGMKSFADGHVFEAGLDIAPREAMRYTMSLPISTLISGMESMEVLEQNLAIARDFAPMTEEERADVLAKSAPKAQGAEFEPFKSTRNYEGSEGRVAHDYVEDAA